MTTPVNNPPNGTGTSPHYRPPYSSGFPSQPLQTNFASPSTPMTSSFTFQNGSVPPSTSSSSSPSGSPSTLSSPSPAAAASYQFSSPPKSNVYTTPAPQSSLPQTSATANTPYAASPYPPAKPQGLPSPHTLPQYSYTPPHPSIPYQQQQQQQTPMITEVRQPQPPHLQQHQQQTNPMMPTYINSNAVPQQANIVPAFPQANNDPYSQYSQPPSMPAQNSYMPTFPQQQLSYDGYPPNPNYTPTMIAPSPSPPMQPKKVERIDPRQIPRPSEFRSEVVKYYTRSGILPPSSTADYQVVDEGNASPRFVRLTTHHIAADSELVDNTKLCIGAIIQPLAPLGEGEDPIPLIEYPSGPVRCGRCLAYVNPFFQFIDNGASFICNICKLKNEVPVEYRCNLDANGLRRDRNDRPELCRGSVEYSVGKEFLLRPISDPTYLFVVDVSYNARVSGFTKCGLDSIKASLDVMASNPRVKVGIITYDRSVHFYSLSTSRSEPILYVMSDIDDVFVPCPHDELLVPVSSPSHFSLLQSQLTMIESLFITSSNTNTMNGARDGDGIEDLAFGAAISAAAESLLPTGGKILIGLSSLPNLGAGALTMRDNAALYNTDKERTLQSPQNSFYHTLATKCAENAISVDLFVGAHAYVDIATMGALSEKTGGQVYIYPSFSAQKDGEALLRDVYHNCTRVTGFDGVMIVRVSQGLRVAEHFGSFYHRTVQEMDLPCIDSDKTFAVRLEHEGKLEDKSEACIQVALLYTTVDGYRRIRVHTISVPVTSAMSNIFRYSDLDSIINLSLRQAVRQLLDSTTCAEAQLALTNACIDSLFVYRKYCASATSAGQLILPEPLKLLPLCTLGMLKHSLFASGVAADERAHLYLLVNSMPVYVALAFVCPRLYCLTDLPIDTCMRNPTGRVFLPQSLSLSSDSISPAHVYLLDDARFLYVYVGREVANEMLSEIFTPGGHGNVGAELRTDVDDPNHISVRIATMLFTLRRFKSHYQSLQLISARHQPEMGVTLDESLFYTHLVEDTSKTTNLTTLASPSSKSTSGTNGPPQLMSYIDFLCYIHKKIQNKFY